MLPIPSAGATARSGWRRSQTGPKADSSGRPPVEPELPELAEEGRDVLASALLRNAVVVRQLLGDTGRILSAEELPEDVPAGPVELIGLSGCGIERGAVGLEGDLFQMGADHFLVGFRNQQTDRR